MDVNLSYKILFFILKIRNLVINLYKYRLKILHFYILTKIN